MTYLEFLVIFLLIVAVTTGAILAPEGEGAKQTYESIATVEE